MAQVWYCYATTMADNISIADAGDIITAADVEGALQEIAGDVGNNYWYNMPAITRVSDTEITITDTGGADNYTYKLSRATLRWSDSGVKLASVNNIWLDDNTVHIILSGDAYTASAASVEYHPVK